MRREFSPTVRLNALRRSGYRCECHLLGKAGIPGFSATGCGVAVGPGNTYFEHIIPDDMLGKPDLENCAVLCRTCWRLKTYTYDAPKLAKTRAMAKAVYGIKDRGSPMPGSRKSPFKRKMNGRTERR